MTQYPTYRINKSPISACKRPATTLSEFGVLFSFTIMISCEMQYTVFFCKQLFFRRLEPRILEKPSNSKATFEPHIGKLKQLSFKMPYFSNLVPKSVRNLSNYIATFSLIFAQNVSNLSLDNKKCCQQKKTVYSN